MNNKILFGFGSAILLMGGCVERAKLKDQTVLKNEKPTDQAVLVKEIASKPEPRINETLAVKIKELSRPTNQDIAASENGGFNSNFSKYLNLFTLSPRRQTQQIPLEMMAMMPEDFHSNVAIIIPERLLQNPGIPKPTLIFA